MAHVVTLSLSRDRVPRWFTEGLSMMEERRGGPGWGDPISVHFIRAWEQDKLLPIADLNQGFVHPEGPEQITNSYFQAGWICELMERHYGMEKLRAMLDAYGTGKTDDEVFKEVLNATTEEVDGLFSEELDARLGPLSEKLKTVKVQDETEDGFRQALALQPDNFFLNLALGSLLVDKGETRKGVQFLEKARSAFPDAVEEGGPYDLLAKAYLKLDDTESARRILTEWWARHPALADTALQLVKLQLANHQNDEARQVLEQAMYADPFTAELHEQLGKLYFEEAAYPKAVREYKTLLALNPPDEAGARYQLAKAFFESGSREQARMEVLLALEIAPTFEDAQKLLLEIARR
jgi:tetratricopeptide (TPR) repeat protein